MQLASRFRQQVEDSLPTRCASYSFCRRRAVASLSRARAFITAQPGRNIRPAHCGPRPNPRQREIQTPFPTDTGRATRPTFSPKAGQLQTSLFLIITRGWAMSGKAWGKTATGGLCEGQGRGVRSPRSKATLVTGGREASMLPGFLGPQGLRLRHLLLLCSPLVTAPQGAARH